MVIKPEVLVDIGGAAHLELEYGERFRSWYLFKEEPKRETVSLNYKGLTYNFTVCDWVAKFIMPAKIEFIGGMMSYSNAERFLGVFRFPFNIEKGEFFAPVPLEKTNQDIKELSTIELKDLLSNRKVLTFEAFRIPQVVFKYFNVTDFDFKEIASMTNTEFSDQLKEQYQQNITERINGIKEKICSFPNYLLILENTLNRQWKDFKEIAFATNKIIDIG